MRMTHSLVALSIATALGLSLGSVAQAEQTSGESQAAIAPSTGQARLADTTRNLERVFNDQFVKGNIDRAALVQPIGEFGQAMPEGARPRVQAHIEQVLQTAEKLATQMTSQERTQAVQPAEKVGATAQSLIGAWGWPAYGGWGGFGAFGFPGMYTSGVGLGFGGLGFGGLGFGAGYGNLGWGGLGTGGWFW